MERNKYRQGRIHRGKKRRSERKSSAQQRGNQRAPVMEGGLAMAVIVKGTRAGSRRGRGGGRSSSPFFGLPVVVWRRCMVEYQSPLLDIIILYSFCNRHYKIRALLTKKSWASCFVRSKWLWFWEMSFVIVVEYIFNFSWKMKTWLKRNHLMNN